MIMTNIILPVDFGKTTDVLLGAAIKFAKEVNGRLCLIHVAPMDLGLARRYRYAVFSRNRTKRNS